LINTPSVLGQNRELADRRASSPSTPRLYSMSGRFLYYFLMSTPAVLGQNRELADEAGFLTVNPKTLQHVK
jgi:hypothetical protein